MANITRVLEDVRDGDTILVKTRSNGSSVFDPANEYDGVARIFRVVVEEGSRPTLELVPVSEPRMITRRLM